MMIRQEPFGVQKIQSRTGEAEMEKGRMEIRKTEITNKNPARKKIAVIFGGCSPEYSVSLQSAYAVISHMDREKYEPVPVGISPDGAWYWFQGEAEKIESDMWCNETDCTPAAVSPDRRENCLLLLNGDKVRKMNIDAAFPVLHGRNGEDGTVQGMLELAGIPVVGCGTLASALCMDKDRAHKLAAAEGIRTPKSFVFGKNADMETMDVRAEEIGYPLFVKPVKAGSSYGVAKVYDAGGLSDAVKSAFAYDGKVIMEEGITGFEVGCAVMGEDVLTVGEVDEIELSDGFFDFEEKYTLKTSSIHVPARISSEKAEEIRQTAQRIYRALDCRGFARVDMFLADSGEIVFNEVNTIPGFTAHSRFPNMMKAAGISFGQILTSAIERAVTV